MIKDLVFEILVFGIGVSKGESFSDLRRRKRNQTLIH